MKLYLYWYDIELNNYWVVEQSIRLFRSDADRSDILSSIFSWSS